MLSKIVKGEAGVPGAGATNHTGYYAGKSLSPEPAGGGAGGGLGSVFIVASLPAS